MSVLGIASGALLSSFTQNQGVQGNKQQLQQDLQTGNLSGAQSAFATLQQNAPQNATSSQNNSPIAQAFSQLAQDLKSGNLTGAQQDYATIQQDFQSRASQGNSTGV